MTARAAYQMYTFRGPRLTLHCALRLSACVIFDPGLFLALIFATRPGVKETCTITVNVHCTVLIFCGEVWARGRA